MVAMQDLGGRARRGLAGGLMEAALYWGVTAGTFLGGWLVSLTGQLLLPFLIMAVIAALCLIVTSLATVDTREAILRPAGFTPQPIGWEAYRIGLTNRNLYVVYFAGLMSKWVDSMIIVMSSLYLKHLGYGVAETAVIQTGFVLSWSTLSLFTGALSDFVGRKNLIWFGMLWNCGLHAGIHGFSPGATTWPWNLRLRYYSASARVFIMVCRRPSSPISPRFIIAACASACIVSGATWGTSSPPWFSSVSMKFGAKR